MCMTYKSLLELEMGITVRMNYSLQLFSKQISTHTPSLLNSIHIFNLTLCIAHTFLKWLSYLSGIDASAQTTSHEMTIPNDVSVFCFVFFMMLGLG